MTTTQTEEEWRTTMAAALVDLADKVRSGAIRLEHYEVKNQLTDVPKFGTFPEHMSTGRQFITLTIVHPEAEAAYRAAIESGPAGGPGAWMRHMR